MSPRFHAAGTDVLLDEFDFSGVTSSVDLAIENPTPDVTAFADADQTFVEGKPNFTVTVNGFHSVASPDYEGEMFTDLTSESRRLGVYPEGAANGNFGWEGRTNIGQDAIPTERNAAILVNVTWQGNQPIVESQVGYVNTAVGSSANGTKYEFGAIAAAETLVGVLRLLAAPGGAGSNDCIVTVQSDADSGAGGETTRLTFATLNQVSVALHEVVEAAGAVTDTWWRVVVTISGGGTRTFNLIVVFGKRKT